MLEYDMLYGEHYACPPYEPTELQMGLVPLTAEGASWADGAITVTGSGFTDWSRITVDGDELDTTFDGTDTLRAELDEPPEAGEEITVRQRAENMTGVLAESGPYIWPEDGARTR